VLSAGSIIEAGPPEHLYRGPRLVATMALVGFPPANFLRGSLRCVNGDVFCETELFRFPADVHEGVSTGDVLVGIRPERILLSHHGNPGASDDPRRVHFGALVRLREDLGGEDVVYLEASGVPLTVVDREHYRGEELDENVSCSVAVHHLALFDATSGESIGRGTAAFLAAHDRVGADIAVSHG
jgi:ABC-type sugar transport system ATPase subunit